MRGTAGETITRLNLAEFDRLTGLRGWDTDAKRAAALGIAPSTMSRVRNGVDQPGSKFIRRALAVLMVPYRVLFIDKERIAA